MSSMTISNLTKEMLKKMFSSKKRFDGRDLFEYRELKIEKDISKKAEGSARVCLGKTEVLVGVKLAIGEPYPDSLDKGNLTVSADLLPLASPRFEQGPPGFNAIELPRLVDRAIRESGMIDLSKLVIKEKEKVWTIFIDIYPINDDGNLVDASTIGAIIALQNTKIPVLEGETINYEKKRSEPLPLVEGIAPISISFYKIGNSLFLDPTREEEEACNARITWGISQIKDQKFINSCQKSGEATFLSEEIEEMMKILPKKFEEINEKIKKAK